MEAVKLGVRILHTASRPMSNGPSVPSTESVVRNLELMGHTHSIDTELLAPVAEHFRRVGKAAGYLVDQVSEYDLFNITHQVPGGMLGTLRAQLEQHGMTDRIHEVLAETGAVRRDLGWPVMATPLSQLVGTQAVLNVVTGERYSMVPDEVVAYAVGHYGVPPAPIDPDVLDRIMSSGRAAEIAANPPEQPTLEELRKRHGTGTDDDLLILKALIPPSDIEAMQAAGPLAARLPVHLARDRADPSPDGHRARHLRGARDRAHGARAAPAVSVETAVGVGPSSIDLAYERFGDPAAPPVLLVMGLGTQMLGWDEGFCAELVARGLQPIRFDNRDIGLSTHIADAPAPDLLAALRGDAASAPYTLPDMAADSVGLLDALDLESAHVVGASMGGMIAQAMAIEHPGRVRSLTSIMSTTGDRSVGQPTAAAMQVLMGLPVSTREEAMDRAVAVFRLSGRPASSSTRPGCASGRGSPTTAPTIRSASPARWSPSSPRPTAPSGFDCSTCPRW